MTIKDFIEENKGKYDDIEYDFEATKEDLEKDINEYIFDEMNGCEFYLYLQKDCNGWNYNYEDETEEEKECIRKYAWDMYEYTENDKFLVIFKKKDWYNKKTIG